MIYGSQTHHIHIAHRELIDNRHEWLHGHTLKIELLWLLEECSYFDVCSRMKQILSELDGKTILCEDDPLADGLSVINEPFLKVPFIPSLENIGKGILKQFLEQAQLPATRLTISDGITSIIITI